MSNKWLRDNGMHLSWLLALIATLGSLYFSEIMNFIPCKLCWYQRILMYPLVVLLGIAAVRRDYKLTDLCAAADHLGSLYFHLPCSAAIGCIS